MCLTTAWVIVLSILLTLVLSGIITKNSKNVIMIVATWVIVIIFNIYIMKVTYPDALGISSPITLEEGSYKIVSVTSDNLDYYIILQTTSNAPDFSNQYAKTSRFYEIPKDTIVLDKTGKDHDNLIMVKWQNGYPQMKLYYTREIQQVNP